jgi:hypothetical protein
MAVLSEMSIPSPIINPSTNQLERRSILKHDKNPKGMRNGDGRRPSQLQKSPVNNVGRGKPLFAF